MKACEGTRAFESLSLFFESPVTIDNALLVNIYPLYAARALLSMLLSFQLPYRHFTYSTVSTRTFAAAIKVRRPLARWIGKPKMKRPS